jgi:hypothetical protein
MRVRTDRFSIPDRSGHLLRQAWRHPRRSNAMARSMRRVIK